MDSKIYLDLFISNLIDEPNTETENTETASNNKTDKLQLVIDIICVTGLLICMYIAIINLTGPGGPVNLGSWFGGGAGAGAGAGAGVGAGADITPLNMDTDSVASS